MADMYAALVVYASWIRNGRIRFICFGADRASRRQGRKGGYGVDRKIQESPFDESLDVLEDGSNGV